MSEPRPEFVIVLRPEPHVADPIRALRRGVKYLLRGCGLRVVTLREYPATHAVESVRQSNARRYGGRRRDRSGQEIGISGTLRSDAKFSHG